jgi:NAD(P)-dependent dehydrogenase (short-subunit alcohol dehydrogenase family)
MFTSSGLASLEWAATSDGNYNGAMYRTYRSTKTALNMIMVSYARELEGEGFVVSASDPGYECSHTCMERAICANTSASATAQPT